MELREEFIRYAPIEAQKKLSERLGFHWYENTQDWDLIESDSGRIREFLQIYKSDDLSDDEKFALMELIISSFDDLIEEGGNINREEIWTDCKHILISECCLHITTVHYWSSLEDKDPKRGFLVTEFIRPIWDSVKSKFI
ncbi:MAG: hypothetical protein Roseis2KO_25120 [Roseivirga sp.]